MMTREGIGQEKHDGLFMGYEVGTGKVVYIPVFHMLMAGQTQMSGKTTLLKALASQAIVKGYKVLLFDTKEQYADYTDFGKEIPICLRETTDSLTILGLLESIMQRKLSQQYPTLIRVAEGAKNFQDVIDNAKKLEETARAGFVKDAARMLVDLLQRLLEQTKERKTTSKLELTHPINRITVNEFALEGQQMIVKTAFEDALKIEGKLIIILDEASKFLPQAYSSACKKAIYRYVTQGAISKKFMWMGTQFLATTSKDAMKAMDVKVLGRQSHDTECEHTIDLIPRSVKKFAEDQIMMLKLGHFVTVAENWVKVVYACPENAEKSECIEVALGKREPKNIHYSYLLTGEQVQKLQERKTEVVDFDAPIARMPPVSEQKVTLTIKDEKKKVSEETVPIEKPKEEVLHTDGTYRKESKRVQERRKPAYTGKPFAGAVGERIELLENNIEGVRGRLVKLESIVETTKENLDKLDSNVKISLKMIDGGMQNFRGEIDKWVQHVQDQKITLEQSHIQVKTEKTTRQFKVDDETIQGRIITLGKEGFFKDWHSLREVVEAFDKHHWTVNPVSIKLELYALAGLKKDREKSGFLSVKQNPTNKEYLYALSPNVEFLE